MKLNKIYNIDNIIGLRKYIPDNSIDLTVTSPPYDNLRNYNGFDFNFEGLARELFRVTKKGGVVVWIVNDSTAKGTRTGTSFEQALFFKKIGFNLHDVMIFESIRAFHDVKTAKRYKPAFEFMFIFSRGRPKKFHGIKDREQKSGYFVASGLRTKDGQTRNNENRKTKIKPLGLRTNIWKPSRGGDNMAHEHPAIFPEQLAADHIRTWTNEKDIVLDPFMGSGTTAKMAKTLKRKFVGFEISAEYCQLAKKRLML